MALLPTYLRHVCFVCLCSVLVPLPAAGAPRPLNIVVINPELSSPEEKTRESVQTFTRRLEEVLKWKSGTMRGHAFRNLEEAQAFIDKEQPVLGILAVHPFVQLYKARKVQIVGYASPNETKHQRYNLLSRSSDSLSALPHQNRNLRLAGTVKDMQWLNVIFDGNLDPRTHFQHVAVASEEEAVEAVSAKRADVALVWGEHLKRYEKHLRQGGLRVSFTSSKFPPLTVVTFKHAAKSHVKAAKPLAKALPEVCNGAKNVAAKNLATCAALGFHTMEAKEHELHPHLIYKYENYK